MAVSGVDRVIELIQTVAGTIAGIRYAPTSGYPRALDTSLMPAALTYVGMGLTKPVAFQTEHRITERTYLLAVYIEPVGQSTHSTRMLDANRLLQAFIDTYTTNRKLADGVTIIEDIRDGGVSSGADLLSNNVQYLSYNQQSYTGFVLELRIKETHQA